MVERILRPPNEDIIKSAKGVKTEGYKHQLYFHYPKIGGIQSLFDAYNKLNSKVKIIKSQNIKKISQNLKNHY